MRAYFKLIVVLVVVGVLLSGYVLSATGLKKSESSDAIQQETYVSEVIIQAPWGEASLYDSIHGWYAGKEESKPGEFGMHEEFQEPEATGGLIIGPNSFTVAPNGDIYINDPLNKRIQRFGPNGEFISVIPVIPFMGGAMCADTDNNIYIYAEGGIHKFDQAGNLLRSYPIETYGKREGNAGRETKGLQGIYCDNMGKVFMSFYYSYNYRDTETRKVKDIDWDGICQVGTSDRAFSFEEQKSTIKRGGFLGSNSAALSKGYFTAGGGNLYLVSFGGDTIKTFKSPQGAFFGCDENLNIYTTKYDMENRLMIVRKYSQEGKLVSMFGYRCGKPYKRTFGGRNEFLDSKGNIYVFCESYKDGIKVTRWYKSD